MFKALRSSEHHQLIIIRSPYEHRWYCDDRNTFIVTIVAFSKKANVWIGTGQQSSLKRTQTLNWEALWQGCWVMCNMLHCIHKAPYMHSGLTTWNFQTWPRSVMVCTCHRLVLDLRSRKPRSIPITSTSMYHHPYPPDFYQSHSHSFC